MTIGETLGLTREEEDALIAKGRQRLKQFECRTRRQILNDEPPAQISALGRAPDQQIDHVHSSGFDPETEFALVVRPAESPWTFDDSRSRYL